jgi:hypothetical protein
VGTPAAAADTEILRENLSLNEIALGAAFSAVAIGD